MARKAATAEDPMAPRIATMERVKARRPQDQEDKVPNRHGGPPALVRTPMEVPLPRQLEPWLDAREMATFGLRPFLTAAQAAAYAILTAMRTGDEATVREAVRAAGDGDGMDARERYHVYEVLQAWDELRDKPAAASGVVGAAKSRADRLGWAKGPRLTDQGPGELDQTPGRRVA